MLIDGASIYISNQPMIEEHGIDHDAEDDNELNSEDDVPGPDHEENDE